MNFEHNLDYLRRRIDDSLSPLVSKSVILPDVPYYQNIGDILIWEGTESWLRKSGRKKVRQASSGWTFDYPHLDPDVTILMMGGGNFGDLWRIHQEDRLKIVAHYPHNRIVMLPQSVWYDDPSLIAVDAEVFAAHHDLHLCARDNNSYDFLKTHFSRNNIHLVPDMALCIDEHSLIPFRGKDSGRRLLLLRNDKELAGEIPVPVSPEYDVHDWPTFERGLRRFRMLDALQRRIESHRFNRSLENTFRKGIDFAAPLLISDKLMKLGCSFMQPYSHIKTTRLHGLILAMMLHKEVEYIDNSTGKLSSFVETWLNS